MLTFEFFFFKNEGSETDGLYLLCTTHPVSFFCVLVAIDLQNDSNRALLFMSMIKGHTSPRSPTMENFFMSMAGSLAEKF